MSGSTPVGFSPLVRPHSRVITLNHLHGVVPTGAPPITGPHGSRVSHVPWFIPQIQSADDRSGRSPMTKNATARVSSNTATALSPLLHTANSHDGPSMHTTLRHEGLRNEGVEMKRMASLKQNNRFSPPRLETAPERCYKAANGASFERGRTVGGPRVVGNTPSPSNRVIVHRVVPERRGPTPRPTIDANKGTTTTNLQKRDLVVNGQQGSNACASPLQLVTMTNNPPLHKTCLEGVESGTGTGTTVSSRNSTEYQTNANAVDNLINVKSPNNIYRVNRHPPPMPPTARGDGFPVIRAAPIRYKGDTTIKGIAGKIGHKMQSYDRRQIVKKNSLFDDLQSPCSPLLTVGSHCRDLGNDGHCEDGWESLTRDIGSPASYATQLFLPGINNIPPASLWMSTAEGAVGDDFKGMLRKRTLTGNDIKHIPQNDPNGPQLTCDDAL